MDKQEFYKAIEDHLKKRDHYIAITQGKKKLQKNTNINKYNFALNDVLQFASSVEDFIEKANSEHGFTSGAVLSWRKKHGTSTALIKEIRLNFSDKPFPEVKQELATNNMHQQPKTPTLPQPQYAPPAMGRANVDQSEYIGLQVQKERYAEIVEKLAESKEELRELKSDKRRLKDENYDLKRKLETIKDKHDIKLERALNDKKGFLDTDTGKEVVTALAGNIPQILAALKPQQAAMVGMGTPQTQGLTRDKQGFISELINVPDEDLPFYGKIIRYTLNSEEFRQAIEGMVYEFQSLQES